MSKEKKSYNPGDDEVNSLVSSVLKPTFQIIDEFIPSFIRRSRYLWYILSIIILLILLHYNIFNLKGTLTFFIVLLFIEAVSLNTREIKTFFQWKDRKNIDEFFSQLNMKSLDEILQLLDKNKVCITDLFKLLKSKYKNHYNLHEKIIESQTWDSVFVDALISTKIINKLPVNIQKSYILFSSTSLSIKAINYFEKSTSIDIKGALVLTHSPYFSKKNIFQILLSPLTRLNIWITKGLVDKNNRLIIFLVLTTILMYVYRPLLSQQAGGSGEIYTILSNIGAYFIACAILAAIIFKIFSFMHFKLGIPLWGFFYKNTRIELGR